jgi:hypothetical protein
MPTGPPPKEPKEPTLPITLPDDPRVEHRSATLNGVKHHYLYAEPSGGKWKATICLVGRLEAVVGLGGRKGIQNATAGLTMLHSRFMDGPTPLRDGAFKSPCF